MNELEILKLRLYNTGLSHRPFKTASQAVSHLGAVQAQDFPAAKWALGLRVWNSTDQTISEEFNAGKILRTHVLRPTWHFVLPADIRWMLELTAPRIKTVLSSYNRKLGLDSKLLTKSSRTIVRALQRDSYLSRREIKEILRSAGIQTDVQCLAHIMVAAELEGLICSGPLRGKEFTYALLEERAPKAKKLVREEALYTLAHKYFSSHGPAQIKDFCWWSGLTMPDAQKALHLIQSKFQQETIDGRTYWFVSKTVPVTKQPSAFLLSVYDEYTIAYKDRSDLSASRDIEKIIRMGNAVSSVMILNGKVAGTWKKVASKNHVEIKLQPFRKLVTTEIQLLKSHIARYCDFLGAPSIEFSYHSLDR